METEEKKYDGLEERMKYRHHHSRLGRIMGGFIIVGVGLVFLFKQLGYYIPEWVFTWEMVLITLGVYIGAKHLFRHRSWLIMVLIGSIFIIDDIIPGAVISDYLWPILIICVGLFVILIPRRRFGPQCKRKKKWEKHYEHFEQSALTEDRIDSVSVFGGVKKNIISKDFKGGGIVCVFGGAEINLSQSDINGKIELEITQVFGGTKLIIPAHWQVQSDIAVVFSGIDDKRSMEKDTDPNKILVLKGTSVFAGIEIKNY